MGGFFSALGSLAGGTSEPAAAYGHQVRQQLESRRHDLADMIGQAAATESDPARRSELLGHHADLLAGKPIGKIAVNFSKTLQKWDQDQQHLNSVFPAPKQPEQKTMPAPAGAGQTPGTTVTAVQAPVTSQPPTGFMEQNIGPAAAASAPNSIAAMPAQSPVASTPLVQEGTRGGGTSEAPLTAPHSGPVDFMANQIASAPPVATPAPVDLVGQGQAQTQPAADPRAMRKAIIDEYEAKYKASTPAMRPFVKAAMDDALAQLQPFEQTAQRKAEFEAYKNTEEFKALPKTVQAAYAAQAHGFAPVNLPPGAYAPNKFQSRAEELDPAVLARFGIPATYKGPVTISKDRMTGETMDVVPGNPGVGMVVNPDGTTGYVLKNVGATGGVAPGMLTQRLVGVDPATGRNQYSDRLGLRNGLPFLSGAVNPSFVPTTRSNISQKAGELPTFTSSTSSRGGLKAVAGGGSSGSSVPAMGGGNSSIKLPEASPLVKQEYEDYLAGRVIPTGGKLTAVQDYAQKHGLPMPDSFSATGQAGLQSVDAVFKEIDSLDNLLKNVKDDVNLGPEFVKYKSLGLNTPYNQLFTEGSFEGLRSAAAALKGNNSRAWPVIQKAFEHIPVFDHEASLGSAIRGVASGASIGDAAKTAVGLKADSIPVIKDKLKAMRKILTDTKETIIADERKGGVVPGATSPSIEPVKGSTVMFMVPGNPKPYNIPANEVDAFLKDFPNAKRR